MQAQLELIEVFVVETSTHQLPARYIVMRWELIGMHSKKSGTHMNTEIPTLVHNHSK